jgi:ATPase family associated with various cellular activities (AAA)
MPVFADRANAITTTSTFFFNRINFLHAHIRTHTFVHTHAYTQTYTHAYTHQAQTTLHLGRGTNPSSGRVLQRLCDPQQNRGCAPVCSTTCVSVVDRVLSGWPVLSFSQSDHTVLIFGVSSCSHGPPGCGKTLVARALANEVVIHNPLPC